MKSKETVTTMHSTLGLPATVHAGWKRERMGIWTNPANVVASGNSDFDVGNIIQVRTIILWWITSLTCF